MLPDVTPIRLLSDVAAWQTRIPLSRDPGYDNLVIQINGELMAATDRDNKTLTVLRGASAFNQPPTAAISHRAGSHVVVLGVWEKESANEPT